jgi:hypothetical protein
MRTPVARSVADRDQRQGNASVVTVPTQDGPPPKRHVPQLVVRLTVAPHASLAVYDHPAPTVPQLKVSTTHELHEVPLGGLSLVPLQS